MFGGKFGTGELLLLLLVLVLLFGARKLPETARGLGRSLRIFKAETKGLRDDDEADAPPVEAPRSIERPTVVERPTFEDPAGSRARERRADEV
jgi:sec-independent protein translocase protein TatA